jgi:hypothetical protein
VHSGAEQTITRLLLLAPIAVLCRLAVASGRRYDVGWGAAR